MQKLFYNNFSSVFVFLVRHTPLTSYIYLALAKFSKVFVGGRKKICHCELDCRLVNYNVALTFEYQGYQFFRCICYILLTSHTGLFISSCRMVHCTQKSFILKVLIVLALLSYT